MALSRFGDYRTAFRFGQVGFELVEGRGLRRFQGGTYLYFGTWVAPWMKHVRTSADLQRRAFDTANKIGDLTYAAYTMNTLNTHLLFGGDPLSEVQREAEASLVFAEKARLAGQTYLVLPQLALIRTLRGLTPRFGCFDDEDTDEVHIERHLAEN